MSPVSILVIAVVLLLFIIIVIYNQLVKKRILVKEAWSGIGTFLQQRNDMIPNLVETVKGYALHESSTLADIVKWRNKGASASNPSEQMDAGDHLNKSLMDFFALAEAYPDLKANSNFMSLQADLKEMETRINQSRRYYNGTVRSYNQAIAVFPSNILAGIFGFTAEPFFEEEAAARNLPGVSFK
ncbi:LemA family protein [Flavihumibacter rivuli]|uniref:LemA family protein n=1 Tax=Flavihumibacter rivuli TaxID=2838156 RepID=UPI001BDEF512|nr:LemA family protein [Flavihumibacter rivuli]ULQ57715.1 LemA family protein [Flavihumibacter rivuli]